MGTLEKKRILEEAKANINKALVVISEDALCGRLNLNELIELIGAHADLRRQVTEDTEAMAALDGYGLAQLAKDDEAISGQILQDHAEKLHGFDLALIGKDQENIALQIIQEAAFKAKLSSHNIVQLAEHNPKVREIVYNDKDLFDKLTTADLALFLSQSEEMTEAALQNVEILKRLVANFDDLKLADQTVPNIYKHIDGDILALLGQRNEKMALKFLRDDHFKNNFQGAAFATLAKYNLIVALEVLKIEDVLNKLGTVGAGLLAIHHQDVAQKLLTDKAYVGLLSKTTLGLIGKTYPQMAEQIFNDKDLRKIMEEEPKSAALPRGASQIPSSHSIVQLAEHNAEVARQLIVDENIRGSLSGAELVILGKNHIDVVKIIVNTPHLYNKLTADNLIQLVDNHVVELMDLLKEKDIHDKIDRVGLICKKYLFVSEMVTKDPAFDKKISKSYRELLQSRSHAVEKIRNAVMSGWTFGAEYEPLEKNKLLTFMYKPADPNPCHRKDKPAAKKSKRMVA